MDEERPMQEPEPVEPNPSHPQDEQSGERPDQRPNEGPNELADLLPAFAFGFTDAEENQYVRAALQDDPEFARELADYAELAQAMLFSAPVVAAPTELAARIQRAVAQPPPPPRQTTAPPPRPAPLRPWYSRLLLPAAAALGLLALVLLMTSALGYVEIRALRATQRELEEQVVRQQEAISILLENQAQQIVLPAVEDASPAEATVMWRPGGEIGIVQAHNFPPLAEDQVYQLWLGWKGEPFDGGLFTVDDIGSGELVFQCPWPIDELEGMGITAEPAGGSPGPTSPPVVRLEF
jgi:anti-sigma-K factor RskA